MICLNIQESTLKDVFSKIEKSLTNIKKEKQYKVMLVCDEIFTNQIKHADFEDKIADIEFCLDLKEEDISMFFKDNAKKFNPLKKEEPDLETSLNETNLGGLGIFLVKQYTKKMIYNYKNGYNILEVLI